MQVLWSKLDHETSSILTGSGSGWIMDFMNLQSITSHQPAVRIMTLLLIIVVAILFFSFDARYRFKMAKVREEACGTPSTLRSRLFRYIHKFIPK